jgi:DNA primase
LEKINQSFKYQKIKGILKEINIVEVVSKYLNLKKKGNNYVSLCPFHNDHNPSLFVSKEKKIFKCFVCDKKGDVVKFVSLFKKINYLNAIKEIFNLMNIKNDYFDKSSFNKQNNEKLLLYFSINQEASDYFINNLFLSKNEKIKNYLKSRNINDNDIENFKIGYAENNYNSLTNYFSKKGYQNLDLLKLGLIRLNEKNNVFEDVFFNRIIFPINDQIGNCVGFSGRSIFEQSNIKYLHTSTNFIFKKQELIFNFDRLKKTQDKFKEIIIVEGFFDLIALHKLNHLNTLSIMGSIISKQQINKIKDLTNSVLLFFDGDEAGEIANLKIGKSCLEAKINVKILLSLKNNDPDSIINKKDQKINFQEFFHKNQFSFFDYLIFLAKEKFLKNKEKTEVNNYKLFLNFLKNYWFFIPALEKDLYLKKLEKITSINIKKIEIYLNIHQKNINESWKSYSENKEDYKIKNSYELNLTINKNEIQKKIEKYLLKSMIINNKVTDLFLKNKLNFKSQIYSLLFYKIKDYYDKFKLDIINNEKDFFYSLNNDIIKNHFLSINDEIKKSNFFFNQKEVEYFLKKLKKFEIDEKILIIKDKLKKSINEDEKLKLLQIIIDLRKNLNKN